MTYTLIWFALGSKMLKQDIVTQLPTLFVLNPTCLDVVESQRQWAKDNGIKLVADQAFRNLDAAQLSEILQQADGIVLPASIRNAPSGDEMAQARQLKVCAIAASGFEWLDVKAATQNGIVVTNVSGGKGAEAVAEFALGLMLAAARQIVFHHNLLSCQDQTRGMGTCVSGKKLGIVGLGAIGKQVAIQASGFRMQLLAYSPNPDHAFASEHKVKLVSLDELLREADFVTLHARLNNETRGMIGSRQLALMKPISFLINTARKELIDESALVTAILRQQIAGAALDDPPGTASKALLGVPNVIFTPHLGNRAFEAASAVFRSAVESAAAVLYGRRPDCVINPQVYDFCPRNLIITDTREPSVHGS